jgi:hypothetical protein
MLGLHIYYVLHHKSFEYRQQEKIKHSYISNIEPRMDADTVDREAKRLVARLIAIVVLRQTYAKVTSDTEKEILFLRELAQKEE